MRIKEFFSKNRESTACSPCVSMSRLPPSGFSLLNAKAMTLQGGDRSCPRSIGRRSRSRESERQRRVSRRYQRAAASILSVSINAGRLFGNSNARALNLSAAEIDADRAGGGWCGFV
jgi:hypothetical protein